MLIKILELIRTHWRGFLLGIFVLALCLKVKSCEDARFAPKQPLPTDAREVIQIDNTKKTVTITTKNGTKEITGARKETITVGNNNSVKVTESIYGWEHSPIIGIGASNHFKAFAGIDLFYYKKLDLGTGLEIDPSNLMGIAINANVSYNLYSNTSLALSINNQKQVGLFIKARI